MGEVTIHDSCLAEVAAKGHA
jgi:ATP synthase assembly factor FMC1, mitochondrial